MKSEFMFQGMAWLGEVRFGEVGRGRVRRGMAWWGAVRHGKV